MAYINQLFHHAHHPLPLPPSIRLPIDRISAHSTAPTSFCFSLGDSPKAIILIY